MFITRTFATKINAPTGFFYKSIISGPILTRSIISTVYFKNQSLQDHFLQEAPFQQFFSKNSHYRTIHCPDQCTSTVIHKFIHYRTIPCKSLHPTIILHKNSYYRTIFHQKLHYRTILSTFQYHQLSITQNIITSGHQAPNTSSHLKDHPYCQHQYTHILISTMSSRTITWLQSEPLETRYSKTI